MLEKLSQSSGNILGYKVIGKITREDYATLTTDIEAVVQQGNQICLLLDLGAFRGEELKAQSAKLRFSGEYQEKIAKLAIVGEKKWQAILLKFADRFNFTRDTQFFSIEEPQAAWEWLQR